VGDYGAAPAAGEVGAAGLQACIFCGTMAGHDRKLAGRLNEGGADSDGSLMLDAVELPGDEAIMHRDSDRFAIEPVRKRGLTGWSFRCSDDRRDR